MCSTDKQAVIVYSAHRQLVDCADCNLPLCIELCSAYTAPSDVGTEHTWDGAEALHHTQLPLFSTHSQGIHTAHTMAATRPFELHVHIHTV